MELNGLIYTFPNQVKMFLGAFVLVLSIGFYTGLLFVNETSTTNPNGIEENYLGNEADEDAEVMKFKKGSREMLTIVHTHILSMSFIFFLLGGILLTTDLPKKMKTFLLIEPFISVVLTFGSIYLLWLGYSWTKYLVIVSGTFMTASFSIASIIILYQLFKKA
ncbi:hypothetical protein ACFLSU_05840 [Bacteroidota bacterium]